MLGALEKLVPLAPLHQPHNLAPIRTLLARAAGAAAGRLLRHRVPPHAAAACAGFCAAGGDYRGWGAALRLHGLSYAYIASVLALRARAAAGRTVVLHLGNGASIAR